MSQPMNGRVMNYRIGIRTQKSKECLIQFAHENSVSQTGQLVGRKVIWKHGEKTLIGKIVSLHGRNGVVRAKFRKGLPGHALGTTVELVG